MQSSDQEQLPSFHGSELCKKLIAISLRDSLQWTATMKEMQRRPEQNGEKMSRGQRDPTEDARAKIDTQRSEKSCPREDTVMR